MTKLFVGQGGFIPLNPILIVGQNHDQKSGNFWKLSNNIDITMTIFLQCNSPHRMLYVETRLIIICTESGCVFQIMILKNSQFNQNPHAALWIDKLKEKWKFEWQNFFLVMLRWIQPNPDCCSESRPDVQALLEAIKQYRHHDNNTSSTVQFSAPIVFCTESGSVFQILVLENSHFNQNPHVALWIDKLKRNLYS